MYLRLQSDNNIFNAEKKKVRGCESKPKSREPIREETDTSEYWHDLKVIDGNHYMSNEILHSYNF